MAHEQHDSLELAEAGAQSLAQWFDLAIAGGALIVGHNVAFDLACLLEQFPELLGARIWRALEAGAVHCTQIRERLIDIERGSRWGEDSEGNATRKAYSLSGIAFARCGLELDKTTWRLDYAQFDGVPLAEWPEGARAYARDDARATLAVWEAQELAVSALGYEHWTNECGRQTAFAFALYLTSARGLVVDEERLRKYRGELVAKMGAARDVMVAHGLIGPKGSKNMAAIRAAIEGSWIGEGERPRTPKRSIKTSAEVVAQCEHPGLEAFAEFARHEKTCSTFLDKIDASPVHTSYQPLGADTGRTSARSPNIQQLPRETGVRECFVARPGFVFIACDFDAQEVRAFAQVLMALLGRSRLAESFKADPGYDPHSDMAASMIKIDYAEALRRKKARDPAFKDLRQRAKACFHPDTEILTRARGWQRIAELLPTDEVAAAYPQRAGECVIAWEKPLALTKRKTPGALVHLANKGIDLRVTQDHRMLGFRANGEPFVTSPEKLNGARWWASAGVMSAGRFPWGEQDWSLLRLAVATQADGSYQHKQIRFGFTKRRKIERMRKMLEAHPREQWHEGKTSQGATQFVLRAPLAIKVRRLLTERKTLPSWWVNLPLGPRRDVLDEAAHWDSHVAPEKRRYVYCSTQRENVEVLQAIASISGRKSRLVRENKTWKLSIGDHSSTRADALKPKRLAYRGDVVCLSVPSSYVLVRDRGVPVIAGQCIFGFPGGMGAKTMRLFARAYGLKLTQDEAEQLRARYLEFEPYARDYFGLIGNRIETGATRFEQLYSGRLRGDCGYTDGCNTYFQGLASDCSKLALWEVTRRCFGAPGAEGSPLFGCRPVAFIHDEIMIEAPESYAHEAALEIERVMCAAQEELTPDVPARASPALMRRWSKAADAVFDSSGRYVCWEEKSI